MNFPDPATMIRGGERTAGSAKTVIFAINPNSGSSDKSKLCHQIAKTLGDEGFDCQLLTDLQQVSESTRQQLAASNLRAVVAAGGDGTISLLANLLPRETPFAILPLGTENLLSRHLGLRAEEKFFVDLVKHGMVKHVDAGDANGKLFFVVASCGFDAAVVKRMDEIRSGHINYLSWFKPAFGTMLRYRFPTLKISIDGKPLESPPKWAFIFNVPRYAMNLRITPEAVDDDGKLDICTFLNGGVIRGIGYLLSTWMGYHRRLSATHFAQFQSLRIESDSNEPVFYELDGDPGGVLPLDISVRPGALRVLIPDSRK